MNTDGTLVPPPVWTGANAGSARICVYPFLSAFICVSTSWSRAAHTRGWCTMGIGQSLGSHVSAGQDGSMRSRIIRAALAGPSSKSAGHRDVYRNFVAACGDSQG